MEWAYITIVCAHLIRSRWCRIRRRPIRQLHCTTLCRLAISIYLSSSSSF